MRNLSYCQYTYRHRRAFAYTVGKIVKDPILRNQLLERARIHDMDKMANYLIMPKCEASALHKATAPHHVYNGIDNKSDLDLYETIIDYQCAGYTKPDKPVNAYDYINYSLTIGKITSVQHQRFMKLLENLGIAYSFSVKDDLFGMAALSLCNPTEEDILKEVRKYQESLNENL